MDIKKEEAEKLRNKDLFDFLPLDEGNIEKFSLYMDKMNAIKSVISKEAFFKKNDKDETFIDVLLTLNIHQSSEEIHVKTYLLNSFYTNCLDLKKININNQEKINFFMENIFDFIKKQYEIVFPNSNSDPKTNLNDNATQIINLINASTERNETNQKVGDLLKDYFNNFPYSNPSLSEVFASCALLNKLTTGIKEEQNKRKGMNREEKRKHFASGVERIVILNEQDIINVYCTNLPYSYYTTDFKDFTIGFLTGYLPFALQELYLSQDKKSKLIDRGLIDIASHAILSEVIQDQLIANRIMANYETLNANLENKNNEFKKPKTKI